MKAQVEVISEVLNFALGVFIVIGVIYTFTQILTPTLVEESLKVHLVNLLSQVKYYSLEVNELSEEFVGANFFIIVRLPKKLNDNNYQVFVKNNELCVSVVNLDSFHCEINNLNLNGYFESSNEFLKLTKKNGFVSFS